MKWLILILSLISFGAFAADSSSINGSEHMRLGQYDQAIEAFQSQLDDNPFNAMAANNLAVAYAMKREYRNALKWLQRAARMDKSRQDIALNLETLENWLAEHGDDAKNAPIPAAISGPLSPEPPAPW